jgi:hypothetical protein
MRPAIPSGVVLALAWFAFPLVPTLLGSAYYQQFNGSLGAAGPPDPRDWGWLKWVVMAGPLIGYGFLAGSTIDLPDNPARRGPKGWLSSRSLWVAVGPWVGYLAGLTLLGLIMLVEWAHPPSREWTFPPIPDTWWTRTIGLVLFWGLGVGMLAYGWVGLAWAALRRAGRLGRLRRSLAKGLAVAVGFVGTLFGSFWAITEGWRDYFFDPRIAPGLVALASLALMSGCATQTYGEIRRRELFQAMLTAWLLGLALAWRWWSRSRPKPPDSSS